jgi:hypothetical protein
MLILRPPSRGPRRCLRSPERDTWIADYNRRREANMAKVKVRRQSRALHRALRESGMKKKRAEKGL